MKTTILKIHFFNLALLLVLGMLISPVSAFAQDASQDTVGEVQDNSSSFNDSVQFDDMEPIFYEATEEEEPASASGESSGIILYVGIAVVLIVILIVLKRVGKKKSA